MAADKDKPSAPTKSSVGRKKGAGTGLNDLFLAVFGVGFLLSLSMNVMHMTGNFDNDGRDVLNSRIANVHHGSALHKAMDDFKNLHAQQRTNKKGDKAAVIQRKAQQQSQNEEEVVGEEHNTHDLPPEMGMNQHHHSDDNDNNSDLMELATLDCSAFGGPSQEAAQEMVYWQEIPSDSLYVSPFLKTTTGQQQQASQTTTTKFLTFEPDGGGWNNIRMSMESVIALSVAMGRTLVMPPQKKMYLLGRQEKGQKSHFSFADFFPIEEMAKDNKAFNVIGMEEYLENEAMKGHLVNKVTGQVEFPPGNRTNWDGVNQQDYDVMRGYLRNVSITALWRPSSCVPAFPASGNHKDVVKLQELAMQAAKHKPQKVSAETGLFEVNDPDPLSRLQDTLAGRTQLCIYDETLQKEDAVHFQMNHKEKLRLLVHYYAFIFFEDWREQMWMNRFVRDHLHYQDEIQCAAARIVAKVREHVKQRTGGKTTDFDTFHIRRGDFQFKTTRIEAQEIYENSKNELTENSTIFVATDERDKKFFDPLREHYDVLFLDDFMTELNGVNSNLYGMIDQLVASRGKVFFGCFFSTFTGYINRIRGYHSVKDKLPGHKSGELPTTYYYATLDKKFEMHKYSPLRGGFFNREYPTSWRDIDRGIKELAETAEKRR